MMDEALSNVDPRVFDAPFGQYLSAVARGKPPLPPELVEATCDVAIGRAAQTYRDDRFTNWVEATCKSAAIGLIMILRHAKPFPEVSSQPSEQGISRAISVVGSRHLDLYLEAQGWERVGRLTPQEFARRVLSVVDSFGASFSLWFAERAQRVRREGGDPFPPIPTADGLRAALWAVDLADIPPEAEDLTPYLPPNIPRVTGDIGSLLSLEHWITYTAVADFAPRLKWLAAKTQHQP